MSPEATLAAHLMPHQEEGVEFLTRGKCGLLAFEQGLGKTLVAIAAFDRLRAAGEVDAMAVICPNSLKRNWTAELARFAPGLAIQLIEGPPRSRRQALATARAPVTIISYETARVEIAGVLALLSRRRTVMVLDESHAAKNRMSLTSIAAQHFAPRCEYRWLLSGTPVPNAAADLYAQLKIVSGGRPLGSFESFVVSLGDERAAADLSKRIEPLVLRRTKIQCLDLPSKEVVDLRVHLPEWQRRLYDEMRDRLVCEVRMMTGESFRASAPTVLAKLLRLAQLASNPALVLPVPDEVPIKFHELDDLVDSLVRQRGEKVVIWTHYVATLRSLVDRYGMLGAVALYGETPAAERQSVVRLFQEDPGTRVLVANPAAGGTGFTLTAARFAIYESLSWRYDLYAQSQDRIHRIGQERPVQCLRLIAADTVEEVIVQALERKSRLAKALLGDPEGAPAITDLSPVEFCEMLLSNQLPETTV
jgi:SNF2 family DNA or RNA helicase